MFEYTINQLKKLIINLDSCEVNAKSELEAAIKILKENEDKEKELFAIKSLNKCLSDKLAEFRKKYGCEYKLSKEVNK
jgi:hypothetical protein